MNDTQFGLLMDKLEEMRCGVIDVEGAVLNLNVELPSASANTCVMPLPTFIELCESVEKSPIGTLSDRERLVVNRVIDIIGRQQHNT